MLIRAARPDDAARLVVLYAQWGHPQPEPAISERIAAWEATARAQLLVAELDGVVAGVTAVAASPHLARPGWVARLAGLVVDESFRGRGIGAALVAAAEERARAWDCDRIELTASRSRDAVTRFYPALGYEERSGRHARFVREL